MPERWRGEAKNKYLSHYTEHKQRLRTSDMSSIMWLLGKEPGMEFKCWSTLNSQVFLSITIPHLLLRPCHPQNAFLTAVLNSSEWIKAMGRELVQAWAPPPAQAVTSAMGVNLSALKFPVKGARNGNGSISIVCWAPNTSHQHQKKLWVLLYESGHKFKV